MSDVETYDNGGYNGGEEYDHYAAGQEHNALDELHQDQSAVAEYDSNYGVYANEHHADENTDLTKFHQEQVSTPYVEASSTDYVDFHHSESVDDSEFAAYGNEHSFEAQESSLDALQARFDSAFVEGTHYSGPEYGVAAH